ncbi:hypothetical protein ACFV4P_34170 [Kitasatospora sp. NPDC059795]|uniref:hypothetical protein n=1 Tax=Kitasatospora sp. NPDC059795 TaxID=3346949 RepID=UPI00366674D6
MTATPLAAGRDQQRAWQDTVPRSPSRIAAGVLLVVVVVFGLGTAFGLWAGLLLDLVLALRGRVLLLLAFQAVIVVPAVAHEIRMYRAGDHPLVRWRARREARLAESATTGAPASARPGAEEQ